MTGHSTSVLVPRCYGGFRPSSVAPKETQQLLLFGPCLYCGQTVAHPSCCWALSCSTAHGIVPTGMFAHVRFPKSCSFAWGDLDLHLVKVVIGPKRIRIPNGISIGLAVFLHLHSSRQRVAIPNNGSPLPPSFTLSTRYVNLPSNASFLGPTRVLNPNGISIGSAVFASLIKSNFAWCWHSLLVMVGHQICHQSIDRTRVYIVTM